MSAGAPRGDLVFVGDVHLDCEDEALRDFLAFLRAVARTAPRIVLAGDLFKLWLGRRELELPHHRAVLETLRDLRGRGVVLRYLEGNRDFHIAQAYAGDALDDATDRGIVERWGGRRLFAIHGDLANAKDRVYRLWRRVARSAPAWTIFNRLSPGRRQAAAQSLEARMKNINLGYKSAFPEAAVRAYAARFLREGHDAVVLGHFHTERILEAVPPSAPGTIFVLPEWKESRRHLRVAPDGRIEFVDSPRS